jgi:GT2 family glycosyltransferase
MNDQRPEISAIVIVFNGRNFLPDCLGTLTDDLRDLSHEIVAIDNGSTDSSVAFIEQQFPKVRVIENGENLGFAKAVNIGLLAAQGAYLYLLNQDLRFRKGTAGQLLRRLKSDPQIGMIGPRYVGFDGKLQRSARAFPRYRYVFYRACLLDRVFSHSKEFAGWEMGWFDHLDEREVDQPMGSVMLLPQKVVDEIGLMDESFPLFFNDVDYCRRLANAGYKRLYYPGAVVEHSLGGSTRERPYRSLIESHRSMYRYLKKYSRPAEMPLLLLSGMLLVIGLIPRSLQRFFTRSAKS